MKILTDPGKIERHIAIKPYYAECLCFLFDSLGHVRILRSKALACWRKRVVFRSCLISLIRNIDQSSEPSVAIWTCENMHGRVVTRDGKV